MYIKTLHGACMHSVQHPQSVSKLAAMHATPNVRPTKRVPHADHTMVCVIPLRPSICCSTGASRWLHAEICTSVVLSVRKRWPSHHCISPAVPVAGNRPWDGVLLGRRQLITRVPLEPCAVDVCESVPFCLPALAQDTQ